MGLILTDLIDMCAPVIKFNNLTVEIFFQETKETKVMPFNQFREICLNNKDLKLVEKLLHKKELMSYYWTEENIKHIVNFKLVK